MKKTRFAMLSILFLAMPALTQISTDVIGQHALGPGSTSPVKGTAPGSCQYCHAPHSGKDIELWNQTLTTQTYTPYTSPTYAEKGNTAVPQLTDTNLCLSCHDGTVAPGATVVYGQIATGHLTTNDTIASLQPSHPVSLQLPLVDAADLVASLAASGTTADPTNVKLKNGNLECTSCHNPHVEAKDFTARNFLVKDSSSGSLCLSCHDPNRVLNGVPSPLTGWAQSIHATSTAAVSNLPYGTLALNACFNCHADHNAASASWILRGEGDQVCLNCHSGAGPTNKTVRGGTQPTPQLPATLNARSAKLNVAEEYAKVGHPLSTGRTQQLATTTTHPNGPKPDHVVANPKNPTLSGCIECHDPHAVQATTSYASAPQVRSTQTHVTGLSGTNGTTLVRPARSEYEICLRCHGPSGGREVDIKYGYQPERLAPDGNPRNVLEQFNTSARSSHPVMLNRNSSLPQPSLRQQMLNLDGSTLGRAVGERVYCSDCHNSDDNREFGGTGPNGPHGSKWQHILERRYEFSQASLPGGTISNLFPNPDLSNQGPYSLCAKCHNLSNVMQDASFKRHSSHLAAGFSCSVCHTAHGTQSSGGNSTGERLVNFDLRVVAPNGSPATFNRATGTCTLTCHGAVHNPDGSVKQGGNGVPVRK